MNALDRRGYFFETAGQLGACVIASSEPAASGLRPLAPFAPSAEPAYTGAGALAPAATREGEILWCDSAGTLHRTRPGDELVETFPAPVAIAQATRIVVAGDTIWAAVLHAPDVEAFDARTLSRRFVVDLPENEVIDIAADGQGITVLVENCGCPFVVPVDCNGHVGARVALEGLDGALGFTRVGDRFAVLSIEARRLFGYPKQGGSPLWRVSLPVHAPCFRANAIGGDGRSRVLVAGHDEPPGDGRMHVLVFDRDAVRVGDVPLAETATAITATHDMLVAGGSRGLYLMARAATVPDATPEVSAVVMTPVLEAPEVSDGRRWLRVEADGVLPIGTTLEMRWGTTDDAVVAAQIASILGDDARPAAERIAAIRAREALWHLPVLIRGSDVGPVLAAAPLHDIHDRYVWIMVTLSAGAGAAIPSLVGMRVLYPGRTLMEYLPSIYQRQEVRARDFLRALVGVLETTTQDLDARIAQLGALINPASAPDPWLDYVARWLGLPWDDALSPEQKRALVTRAEDLAKARGTRSGLQVFLDAIVANTTARYRLRDLTVDYGLAMVGGSACEGTPLPALLGGAPRDSARLGTRARLGVMRLPCNGTEEDATSRFLGRVHVDIAADAVLRARWQPWLATLIKELLPVNATLCLRWLSADAIDADRDAGVITLASPPEAHLGTDAVIGAARLPDRGSALPGTSHGSGPTLH